MTNSNFYIGEKNALLKNGTAILTSERLIYRIDESQGFGIHLSGIYDAEAAGGGFFAKYKLRLNLRSITPFFDRAIPFSQQYNTLLANNRAYNEYMLAYSQNPANNDQEHQTNSSQKPKKPAFPLPMSLPQAIESVAIMATEDIPSPTYFCVSIASKSTRDIAVDQAQRTLKNIHQAIIQQINRKMIENIAELDGLDPDKVALQAKKTQRTVPVPGQQDQSQPSPAGHSVGVGALLKRREQSREETDQELSSAVSDLESMMSQAQKVIALTERLLAEKERKRMRLNTRGSNDAADGNEVVTMSPLEGNGEQDTTDAPLDDSYDNVIRSIGISSMVSKTTAGDAFHIELARELADILPSILQKQGGVMGLADVYCLVCKMRGTDLISPEDLLESAQLWQQLQLPLSLRRFAHSGVMVVQLREYSSDVLHHRIIETIRNYTALDKNAIAAYDSLEEMNGSAQIQQKIRHYNDVFMKYAHECNIEKYQQVQHIYGPTQEDLYSNNSNTSNKTAQHKQNLPQLRGLVDDNPLLIPYIDLDSDENHWKNKGVSAIQLASLLGISLSMLRQELDLITRNTNALVLETDPQTGAILYYYNYFPTLFVKYIVDKK